MGRIPQMRNNPGRVSPPTSPRRAKSYKASSGGSSFKSFNLKLDKLDPDNLDKENSSSLGTKELAGRVSETSKLTDGENSVVIILGGTGHLGSKIAESALKRGWRVYATTRQKNAGGLASAERFTWLTMPSESVADSSKWKALVDKLNLDGMKVLVVNAMGGAHPKKGESLYDLNAAPTFAAFEGIADSLEGKDIQSCSYVHYSSLAAELVKDEYGAVKTKIDETLMATKKLANLTILRVSYALEQGINRVQNVYVDNKHAYAPEQTACLPLQPVLGDGNQPVPVVFTTDIVDATFNTADRSGKTVINTISSEKVTQIALAKVFTEMIGKKFRPLHIPLHEAKLLAKHFPMGHFAPYAVEYCEVVPNIFMCYKPFEELLGRPTMTIEEGYLIPDGHKLDYAKPPIKEHSKMVFRKLRTCPEARRDTFKAISGIIYSSFSRYRDKG